METSFTILTRKTFRSLAILPLPPYIWPQMKTGHSFKSVKGKNWTCCKSLNKTQNTSVKVGAGGSEFVRGFSAHVWNFHLLTSLSQTPNGYLSDAVVGGVNVNPTLELGGSMNKTADSSVRRHLSCQLLMEAPVPARRWADGQIALLRIWRRSAFPTFLRVCSDLFPPERAPLPKLTWCSFKYLLLDVYILNSSSLCAVIYLLNVFLSFAPEKHGWLQQLKQT